MSHRKYKVYLDFQNDNHTAEEMIPNLVDWFSCLLGGYRHLPSYCLTDLGEVEELDMLSIFLVV